MPKIVLTTRNVRVVAAEQKKGARATVLCVEIRAGDDAMGKPAWLPLHSSSLSDVNVRSYFQEFAEKMAKKAEKWK